MIASLLQPYQLINEKYKANCTELKQAISDREQKLALDLFRAGLQQSEAEFVGQLRKIGVLRCSNYDYQSQILNSLINETGKINISPDSQVYFKSIKSLLSISRNIQTLFKVLLKEVDYLEIKSYLVAVDSLFWPLDDPQAVDSLFVRIQV
jgi:hypothetical protein